MTTADVVDRMRRHFDDGCFACGRANPKGLGIDGFDLADGIVTATFSPAPDHRGLAGRLHGGLTATALDEIMVWAGILVEGVLSVTGTMEVRYRSPVPADGRLGLAGRVDERRGRRLRLAGTVSEDGRVVAEASGLYLVTASVDELIA